MDDCASFSPASSADLAFLPALRGLTELSWQDTAGAFAWMDPALHSQGGASALLDHAQHLTGLKRCAPFLEGMQDDLHLRWRLIWRHAHCLQEIKSQSWQHLPAGR